MKKISITTQILLLLIIMSACNTTLSNQVVDKDKGGNVEMHKTNESDKEQMESNEVTLYDVIKKSFFKKEPPTDTDKVVKRDMTKAVVSSNVQYQKQESLNPSPVKQKSVFVKNNGNDKGNKPVKDIPVKTVSPDERKQLLKDAKRATKEERYVDVIKLADTILKDSPNDESALAYKENALVLLEDKKHDVIMGKLEKVDAQERDKYFENLREKSIPYNDLLQFTTRGEWEDIKKRVQKEENNESLEKGRKHTERLQKVPAPAQNLLSQDMKNGLNKKVSIEFIDTPLRDAVAFIQEKTKLNFVLDEGAAGKNVNLKLDDVPVGVILKYILPKGVDSVIKDDIIYITQEPLELRVYDVRDLLINLEDRQNLNPQVVTANGNGAGTGSNGESKDTFYRVQEIIDLIVNTVGPASWSSNGGRGLIAAREGMLGDIVVTQAVHVHNQIEDLLASLRSSTDLQVSIEARFIAVSDNFLKEVGSNILDFNATSDHPSNSNPPGTPGLNDAGGVVSGVFNDTGNVFAGSGVASGTNGLNLSYQIVEGFFLKGFLRAVQESDEAETLTSPKITLSNTQRGTIKVVTTFNYIESFNIVSQTPEPVIKEIDDGTTFNVRPIVSADRKYVSLEVHPIITTVTFNEETFQTVGPVSSGGAGGVPATNTIQLPETVKQELSVTVCVPDKGILLIGGLGSRSERNSSNGTPVLSKIPVIKHLFSSKRLQRDIRGAGNLIILIKPTILIREEEESRTFASGKRDKGFRYPTGWEDQKFRYPSQKIE
ncbi:MAG: hypothetical protein MRK02_11265 [Candidatus Scalindua sp.]|nr:hypothetical protein [Candidatus Scalindua sp.]